MSKSCRPGGSVGDPNDTQFSCPGPSEYYKELERYKIASGVENSLAEQDPNVGETMSKASELQMKAQGLLGKKQGDLGVQTAPSKLSHDFELDHKLADAQKYANAAEEALLTNYATRQEERALKAAIDHNRDLASIIYYDNQERDQRAIKDKSRVIQINNDSFHQKKTLIHRLTYVIYFLIYAIGLGIAVAAGLITMRVVAGALLVGMIVLTIYALMTTSAIKTYGEISMDVAKGATRDFIDAVAPQKSCPKRCIRKPGSKAKADAYSRWLEKCDHRTDPNCPTVTEPVMPFDWKVDNPSEASKFFSKGEFGNKATAGGKVSSKPFACKWDGDSLTRPSYEKEIIYTHVPCHYIENRVYA